MLRTDSQREAVMLQHSNCGGAFACAFRHFGRCCGAVAGIGRGHPGHPVQGRSVGRALWRRASTKGFFKAAGVDITGVINGEGGGSSVRAMIASDLGYGETSPAGIIAAINEGQDIKIVDIGSRSIATTSSSSCRTRRSKPWRT